MVIGGLQKVSLSDFPGKISAIVFTRGCNFRCPYCHNPELVDPGQYVTPISQVKVLRFLGSRKLQLQGVVVTGGEPTMQKDLPSLLAAIRNLGFATKLDTNGSNPDLLEEIVNGGLVDYIALDIKAPLTSYSRVTGVGARTQDIERSVHLVIRSGLPHELRTTYVESLLSDEEMRGIAVLAQGCACFVVQGFRPSKTLDPGMRAHPQPRSAKLEAIQRLMEATGLTVAIR
jgi:pyruvate formate lyase activating enzyme